MIKTSHNSKTNMLLFKINVSMIVEKHPIVFQSGNSSTKLSDYRAIFRIKFNLKKRNWKYLYSFAENNR